MTIKYNDKDKIFITLSATDCGNKYEFSIKDNGPGIDTRFHEKIFVIFQTLTPRDTMESTGVGLAIVKKIIEEEGGRIWIESAVIWLPSFHKIGSWKNEIEESER